MIPDEPGGLLRTIVAALEDTGIPHMVMGSLRARRTESREPVRQAQPDAAVRRGYLDLNLDAVA
jgi:hypothetical protein